MSRDQDETLLAPKGDHLPDEDPFNFSPVITPRSKVKLHEFALLNGSATPIEIRQEEPPAPIFYDTPLENHVDEDLRMENNSLHNLNESWKAVRSVEQAISLSDGISRRLHSRRKLANKQLGAFDGKGNGTLYHIPD